MKVAKIALPLQRVVEGADPYQGTFNIVREGFPSRINNVTFPWNGGSKPPPYTLSVRGSAACTVLPEGEAKEKPTDYSVGFYFTIYQLGKLAAATD